MDIIQALDILREERAFVQHAQQALASRETIAARILDRERQLMGFIRGNHY